MLTPSLPNFVFRSLEEIERRTQPLLQKGVAARFVDKTEDSQEVVRIVEEFRNAIVFYQVSGSHTAQTCVNTDRIDIATTLDVQPNR